MTELMIRRMTLADVPQVHQLEMDTFSTPWSYQSFVDEMQTNKSARYMIAERDGQILAFAGAWLIFEEGHITNIAVSKEARGQGIGTAITKKLMQYAANLGVQYLTLEVRKSNLVAQKMYRALGFIQLGVRKRYYEDNNEDALLLVCQHMPEVEEDFSEDTDVDR
ncbi:MAG: ribosomal protein S18-alanine N-acetyltransferase [Clostridiales bacterium]|nr:ribosomal protein S18-alanine N-acetyltransferase [Clostridiales bacterium]